MQDRTSWECPSAPRTSTLLKWLFGTGDEVRPTPAVSPDGATIYIGSEDCSVYALNAATGAEVWSFQTGAMVRVVARSQSGWRDHLHRVLRTPACMR